MILKDIDFKTIEFAEISPKKWWGIYAGKYLIVVGTFEIIIYLINNQLLTELLNMPTNTYIHTYNLNTKRYIKVMCDHIVEYDGIDILDELIKGKKIEEICTDFYLDCTVILL